MHDNLRTVCLRRYLERLSDGDREPLLDEVARQFREPVIDYVRLNILARRR